MLEEKYKLVMSADEKKPLWSLAKQKKRVFEKSLSRYVLSLNTNLAKLVSSKTPLIHPYILLQIFISSKHSFKLEFSLNSLKKLSFTTAAKSVGLSGTVYKFPAGLFPKDTWINLSMNIFDFFDKCFPDFKFQSIPNFTVNAHCKLYRIYNMTSPELEGSDFRYFFVSYEDFFSKVTPKSNWSLKRSSAGNNHDNNHRESHTCYGRMATGNFHNFPEDEISESIHISSSSEEGSNDNSHFFFPPLEANDQPSPVYYESEITKIIQIRPYTPPFAEINSFRCEDITD